MKKIIFGLLLVMHGVSSADETTTVAIECAIEDSRKDSDTNSIVIEMNNDFNNPIFINQLTINPVLITIIANFYASNQQNQPACNCPCSYQPGGCQCPCPCEPNGWESCCEMPDYNPYGCSPNPYAVHTTSYASGLYHYNDPSLIDEVMNDNAVEMNYLAHAPSQWNSWKALKGAICSLCLLMQFKMAQLKNHVFKICY